MELIYNNDFRDYLDQIIRMRVNVLPPSRSISRSRSGSLPRAFWSRTTLRGATTTSYTQMVEKIFAVFLEIEDSSVEIEKIINVYLRFAYQRSEGKEEIIYNNLEN